MSKINITFPFMQGRHHRGSGRLPAMQPLGALDPTRPNYTQRPGFLRGALDPSRPNYTQRPGFLHGRHYRRSGLPTVQPLGHRDPLYDNESMYYDIFNQLPATYTMHGALDPTRPNYTQRPGFMHGALDPTRPNYTQRPGFMHGGYMMGGTGSQPHIKKGIKISPDAVGWHDYVEAQKAFSSAQADVLRNMGYGDDIVSAYTGQRLEAIVKGQPYVALDDVIKSYLMTIGDFSDKKFQIADFHAWWQREINRWHNSFNSALAVANLPPKSITPYDAGTRDMVTANLQAISNAAENNARNGLSLTKAEVQGPIDAIYSVLTEGTSDTDKYAIMANKLADLTAENADLKNMVLADLERELNSPINPDNPSDVAMKAGRLKQVFTIGSGAAAIGSLIAGLDSLYQEGEIETQTGLLKNSIDYILNRAKGGAPVVTPGNTIAEKEGLSTGAKVGITVGVGAGIGLLGYLIYKVTQKGKRRR